MDLAISQRANDLTELELRYGAHNYHPLDLVVERAEDVWLWDVDGKRYLDCVSAYSAVNQGHCHPRIRQALIDQSSKVTLTSRAMRNDRLPGFLEALCRVCSFDMALPTNTGVEAFETAVKLARRWGYEIKGIRKNAAEIIVFSDNFHGRTVAAISASTTPQHRRQFGPFTPGFVAVPFGDAEAVERAIRPETCAVVIEPIQGEGGVNVPRDGYLKAVRELCRRNDVLFVADEIQTGLGRTGDLFACDREGVKPDVLLVGKALGGGFYPISAALAPAPLMHLFREGEHGSTFGGNPLAAAVGQASLDVIVEERLPMRARQAGAKILHALRSLNSPLIADVRGRGLLIGVELTVPARRLSDALLERGVAAKDTHDSVLRIAPPLTVGAEAIDYLLERFEDALKSAA